MKEKEKKQLQAAQIERLKSVVSELGITQGKFAATLGVKQETISMIFNGKRNLSDNIAAKIGLTYKINPNWLLFGEGQKYASGEAGELQKKNQLQKIAAIRETINEALRQLQELENEVNK